jgi:ornithine carbamoyltransferase
MDLTGRHFLTLKDFNKEEIEFLIKLAQELRDDFKNNRKNDPLKGKSLGMIFQKRSTRTRVSTEVAMSFLGGHALFLGKDDIQLGANETIQDTSLVLSRFVDGILARVFGHETVEELAKYSNVPVINALSDKYHPLQILADLMTIHDHYGRFKGLKLAWVGDGNNVCNSLLIGCSKLGLHMSVATPESYRMPDDVFEYSQQEAKKSGCNIEWISDPKLAVKDADIIVTDTFVSMGQEEETNKRKKDFKSYQVNSDLVQYAKPDYKFMHCLPRKQEEVTDDIFYSDHSIVFDEAENRLHTVMAVLLSTMENTSRG